MDEKLNAVIEELVAHVEGQLREVAETKRVINSLRKRAGQEPLYEDSSPAQGGTIRPDQYYGKGFATAAQEFLEGKKRACSAQEILDALIQGGFDFKATQWKADDRLRMVALSLAKNNQKFHKLPNNTFGMLSWYPNVGVREDAEEA